MCRDNACREQGSGRGQFDPSEHQKVVGDDGAQDIPFEPFPSRPRAAVEAEGPFEGGDTGLDARPEVPELLVHPRALRHVGDGETPLLRKDRVLDMVLFREGEVLLGGEAAIRTHLPGHAAVPGLVLSKEGLVVIGVSGVAPHDEAPEDHGRHSTREEDLVTVFGIPSFLHDDVRVVFEEGDNLLGGRDGLSLEDAPVSLVDHLAEDAYGPDEPPGKLPAGEGVFEGMTLVVGELGDGDSA